MLTKVEVRRHWDPITQQTEETTPADGHSIILVWHVEPDRVDGGVPPEVAAVIAEVLTELGGVAFRWSGAPTWSQAEARLIPAPDRQPIRRVLDWLTTSWSSDLVVTRSVAAAVELFEHDWGMQGQVALVFDPRGGNAEPALAALRTRRNWRSFKLVPPVVALMAPIVDGDGAQLTTALPTRTEEIVGRFGRAFSAAGIEFQMS
jgi:hypothetical protein